MVHHSLKLHNQERLGVDVDKYGEFYTTLMRQGEPRLEALLR